MAWSDIKMDTDCCKFNIMSINKSIPCKKTKSKSLFCLPRNPPPWWIGRLFEIVCRLHPAHFIPHIASSRSYKMQFYYIQQNHHHRPSSAACAHTHTQTDSHIFIVHNVLFAIINSSICVDSSVRRPFRSVLRSRAPKGLKLIECKKLRLNDFSAKRF